MEKQQYYPYIFSYTDYYFYIKSNFTSTQNQNLRINRLTNKIELISQQVYAEQNQNSSVISKISSTSIKKVFQKISMVIGTLLINQQPYLLLVTQAQPAGTLNKQIIYRVKNIKCIPFKHKLLYTSVDQQENQKILNFIKNDIINDNFYFCYKQQLTLSRQRYYHHKQKKLPLRDQKFFWNQNLLQKYPKSQIWQIPLVQGFISQLYCQNTYFSFYYLSISRRSKLMSGTRFNSRGVDKLGNSSNFVQTEQIFVCHQWLFSHVGVRGSAPLIWSQPGFGQDIIFYKDSQQQQAMKAHYEKVQNEYNCKTTSINLLSKIKSPQKDLKNRFQFYYYKLFSDKGKYLFFDLNEQTKDKENGQVLINKFVEDNYNNIIGKQNFFCIDRYTNKTISIQYTLPRVNCLDCIDRTNVVLCRAGQGSLKQMELFINSNASIPQKKLVLTRQFFHNVTEIWAKLGDRISMIYCGTQSVATHLTKKQNNSFMSFLSGGIKSINRYYNANVNDGFKQQCIDTFLGTIGKEDQDPLTLSPYFEDNICSQILEQVNFCTYDQIGIYALTWNCNNVDPDKFLQDQKKANKLFWFHEDDVDFVIISLQQMVQLSSYNILLGNNQNITMRWQKFIQKAINKKRTNKYYKYLISYDMVGISTFIFADERIYKRIEQPIICQQIKTGFKGSLGNKGAIIFFIKIDSTRITIINCHLAAGQGKQVDRSADIQYIHQQAIKDRKKRRMMDRSQFRFLIGDMNFRLDAKNQHVRQVLYSIQKQEQNSKNKMTKSQIGILLQALLQKDQLKMCQTQHGSLSTYAQADITFLPTYKYIKGTHDYDPKRTPSWCDRILYYSKQKLKISALKYQDIDCYDSDHKPVLGIYKILLKKQDTKKKRLMIQEYLKS